jgi:hypothetical protein
MAKGPRGEKRPGDVIGAAIMVAKIATGEEADNPTSPDKAHLRHYPPSTSMAFPSDEAYPCACLHAGRRGISPQF